MGWKHRVLGNDMDCIELWCIKEKDVTSYYSYVRNSSNMYNQYILRDSTYVLLDAFSHYSFSLNTPHLILISKGER